MKSAEYIHNCIDIFNADDSLSEHTLMLMFLEYGRKILVESGSSPWRLVSEANPEKYGRYEVYRADCKKQHYETWNGTCWASNTNDITHFREIKPPKT